MILIYRVNVTGNCILSEKRGNQCQFKTNIKEIQGETNPK